MTRSASLSFDSSARKSSSSVSAPPPPPILVASAAAAAAAAAAPFPEIMASAKLLCRATLSLSSFLSTMTARVFVISRSSDLYLERRATCALDALPASAFAPAQSDLRATVACLGGNASPLPAPSRNSSAAASTDSAMPARSDADNEPPSQGFEFSSDGEDSGGAPGSAADRGGAVSIAGGRRTESAPDPTELVSAAALLSAPSAAASRADPPDRRSASA
mmetsp:Transcript_53130/g.158995  ORF Transcript_53130/g.158995 Transcript_53130/m.158995 type:complete len:220 (-) Transcript_53130:605-1264(-)